MALNLYAQLADIKTALDVTTITDDAFMMRCLRHAARLIDDATAREFFPTQAVEYIDGSGSDVLWLPRPLLAASEVALSTDSANTYTALTAETDYWVSDGKRWNRTPYQRLVLNPNGSYASWHGGYRTVRVTGVWGWRPDYANAWENSADTVQDAPLSDSATTITVTSTSLLDGLSLEPRFAAGNLIKIESEFCEVTRVSETTLTVTRAQNGTTAASHAAGTAIYRWQPYATVVQAALTQAARYYKRAKQAYADAGANVELGQLMFAKRLDPDVEVILIEAGLRRLNVG